MRPIIVGGLLTATNTDILANTRLQSMPSGGLLTIEMQSSANTASNNFALTVLLPNGDNPMDGVNIPAGATSGGINADDKMIATYAVPQGGGVQINATLSGTATLAYRITFRG